MNFKIDKCPKCGRRGKLMFSNNPLSPNSTICFDCIKDNLDYNNIEHVNFFCRTYNLPMQPELWMNMVEQYKADAWEKYTEAIIDDPMYQPNLYYTDSTRDIWSKVNKEWEKTRSFMEILKKIEPIRDSYIDRGRLKWGEQYTFEEIIKLDSIYIKTLKANNITNPLQKEAVKTLCKLQIEMDEAIRAKDAKAIKDFSSAYSTFAKQADLENMINETKTDDITTVAELYDYMEKQGFQFKFYDGFDRDEVDRTIKDIQDANRRLILEATGLQTTLDDMIKQRTQTIEEEHAAQIVAKQNIADILDFHPEENEVEIENDDDAVNLNFADDPDAFDKVSIVRKED